MNHGVVSKKVEAILNNLTVVIITSKFGTTLDHLERKRDGSVSLVSHILCVLSNYDRVAHRDHNDSWGS